MLSNSGMIEFKERIVLAFTQGRTSHVTELDGEELEKLCSTMRKKGFPTSGRERQEYVLRCKIYALCFELGIIYGTTPEDWQMNFAKVDAFCMERGTVKKRLREQSRDELVKTLRQFFAVASTMQKRQEKDNRKTMLEEELRHAIQAEDFKRCADIKQELGQYQKRIIKKKDETTVF